MTSWSKLAIRRLFRVVNGGTPTSNSENWGGQIPWATPTDLAKVHGHAISRTDRTLSDLGLKSGSRMVESGSLILSTRAPVGYVAECLVPMAFNQGCKGLEPKSGLDQRYFRYQLLALQQELDAWSQGATFVELSTESLASIMVWAPPQSEQTLIADYLDVETERIDALITKKQRMIELFVLRERVMVGEVFSGLSPGPRLGHVANIRSGAGFPHAHQGVSSGDMPFIKVSDLTSGSDDGRDVVRAANYVSTSTAKELGVRPASPGAVIFPKVGAALLGNARRIVKRLSAFDNNLMVVESREHDPRFLHFWFTLLDLGELANPGPVPSVNELAIKSLRPPLPTKNRQMELVNGLDDTLGTAAKVANALGRQVVLLRERKQALITAAVTGELEIT